jgi:hypothetical protein
VIELPKKRFGNRHGLLFCNFRVYVQVNRHDDQLVEVFVDVDLAEGTTLVEHGHLIGRLVSHALRGGASVTDIIGDLIVTIGDPKGAVTEGPPGITQAVSLANLVGQVMQWELIYGT